MENCLIVREYETKSLIPDAEYKCRADSASSYYSLTSYRVLMEKVILVKPDLMVRGCGLQYIYALFNSELSSRFFML
ncbi:MAG: hypothetical protein ABW157_11900 [Candidatus Thiodiazotropha sp. LLP2]